MSEYPTNDVPVVSGDSPEAVAYALFLAIRKETALFGSMTDDLGRTKEDTDIIDMVSSKKWVLETYVECLKAVKLFKV